MREPQAKRTPRVVVAFFKAGVNEHSAVVARNKAKLVGGTKVSVDLMQVNVEGLHNVVYILIAKTKLSNHNIGTIASIRRKLLHIPSVESVHVYGTSETARNAVLKQVQRNWNTDAQPLSLDSFDR